MKSVLSSLGEDMGDGDLKDMIVSFWINWWQIVFLSQSHWCKLHQNDLQHPQQSYDTIVFLTNFSLLFYSLSVGCCPFAAVLMTDWVGRGWCSRSRWGFCQLHQVDYNDVCWRCWCWCWRCSRMTRWSCLWLQVFVCNILSSTSNLSRAGVRYVRYYSCHV
jgi:hypothetical protein